jgi:hypothetical protein
MTPEVHQPATGLPERAYDASVLGKFLFALSSEFSVSGGGPSRELLEITAFGEEIMGSITLRTTPPTYIPNRLASYEKITAILKAVSESGLKVQE